MSNLELKIEGVILRLEIGDLSKAEAINIIEEILDDYQFNINKDFYDTTYQKALNRLLRKNIIINSHYDEEAKPSFVMF